MSVETDFVAQWEVSPLTISEWQGKLVVSLGPLVNLSFLHSDDWWILKIKPRSLDISGVLWVINLVNFSAKSGCDLHTLFVHGSLVSQTTLHCLCILESTHLLIWSKFGLITIGITTSSLSVSFVMACLMLVNDGAKTLIRSFDRPIDQREFCNVILMDHAKNWSLRNPMNLWVLQIYLVGSLLFVISIGWKKLCRVMLGHTQQSVQWLRQTCRIQTVDRCFKWSFLESK